MTCTLVEQVLLMKGCFSCALLFVFSATSYPLTLRAEVVWADQPANITIAEFLQDHYKIAFGRHETDSLNNFNLVFFYPSPAQNTALLFIVQTWRDERLSEADLRREIRVVAESMFAHFEASLRLPVVARRWRPERSTPNLLIRHVRHSDLRETLGVTIEQNTYFDAETIRRAESLVRARGGIWSW